MCYLFGCNISPANWRLSRHPPGSKALITGTLVIDIRNWKFFTIGAHPSLTAVCVPCSDSCAPLHAWQPPQHGAIIISLPKLSIPGRWLRSIHMKIGGGYDHQRMIIVIFWPGCLFSWVIVTCTHFIIRHFYHHLVFTAHLCPLAAWWDRPHWHSLLPSDGPTVMKSIQFR